MQYPYKGFGVMLVDDPDYKDLVVEMYLDELCIAMLNKEKGADKIEIVFAERGRMPSQVKKADLAEFLRCVDDARRRLLGEVP